MLEAELGFKGERGLSNYEIAVKNGYQGTEQEWLANFGVDFNVCVMKDDIVVISMEVDMDDPNYMFLIGIPYPEGFTSENTAIICKKERPSTQTGTWLVNHVWKAENCRVMNTEGYESAIYDYYESEITLRPDRMVYANPYYDLYGTGVQDDNKYDVEITLMKINPPLTPWNPFEE